MYHCMPSIAAESRSIEHRQGVIVQCVFDQNPSITQLTILHDLDVYTDELTVATKASSVARSLKLSNVDLG